MDHAAARASEILMEHPGFFDRAGPFTLGAVAEAANAKVASGADLDLAIKDMRPLDSAAQGDLSFLDNPKYLPLFAATRASACLVAPKFAGQGPAGTTGHPSIQVRCSSRGSSLNRAP
jgi:UDP-3-O-[3-hydroxymyristoyl] glucosamine N-acyltransferase